MSFLRNSAELPMKVKVLSLSNSFAGSWLNSLDKCAVDTTFFHWGIFIWDWTHYRSRILYYLSHTTYNINQEALSQTYTRRSRSGSNYIINLYHFTQGTHIQKVKWGPSRDIRLPCITIAMGFIAKIC